MGYGGYASDGLRGPNRVDFRGEPKQRKTVFGSHDQTAHVWAQQTVNHGKASDGRIWFDGPTIYSYGSHFPIAHFTDRKLGDRRIVLYNADRYSPTTSQHQGIVWSALRGLPVVLLHVPDLRALALGKPTTAAVRKAFEFVLERLAGYHDLADNGRRYQLDAFRAVFGRKFKAPNDIFAWYGARVAALKKKTLQEKTQRALSYIGRGAIALEKIAPAEWLTVAPEMQAYASENTLRSINYKITSLRSHRLALAKQGGHTRARARASAAIKLLAPIAEQWSKQFQVAQARESRLADLAAIDAIVLDGAESKYLWNVETAARLWSVAIREGRQEEADIIGRHVHAKRWLQEVPETFIPYGSRASKRLTADEWRDGKGNANDASYAYPEYPSALLRRKGDRLETSRGAQVPWRDAAFAFRFIQSRRLKDGAYGRAWESNGKQVRLGHFKLDAIEANGDVRAGCHSVSWSEILRLAVRELPELVQPAYPLPVVLQ